MNLLRNAVKSHISLPAIQPIRSLPFLLRESPRRFSTETEEPASAADDSPIDPFVQTPNQGLIYGRLTGMSKHTLKSDIINLLEGCKLTEDYVKVNYTRNYMPVAMTVQFPSRFAFDNAFKVIARKGRLYKLERVDRSEWDAVMPYNGKTILLQGIPSNALADDVDRFLCGCDYDGSSLQMFLRPGDLYPVKMATVRFSSHTQAMNAFLTKNRGFCLNNRVTVRVLQ